MKKIKIYLLIFSLVPFYNSCNKENILFNDYYDLPESTWSFKDSICFPWKVNDTLAVYDINFQLRASSSYKWSNIYIFSDVYFPNGKARRDTFEFFLADAKGHWLGDRSGLIIDYNYHIYKRIKLPLSGEYKFCLQQAMRDTVLNEVLNVGIKITRPEK